MSRELIYLYLPSSHVTQHLNLQSFFGIPRGGQFPILSISYAFQQPNLYSLRKLEIITKWLLSFGLDKTLNKFWNLI